MHALPRLSLQQTPLLLQPKGETHEKITQLGLSSLAATLVIGINQAAGEAEPGGNALTIYSTALPGAIAPELYRNGGRGHAILGYAVVRQQRDLSLNRGRRRGRTALATAILSDEF